MQWLIDLIIEAIGVPPTYIDRGDPGTSDFDAGDLIANRAWHDLDLSAIVPAGAQAVHIGVEIRHINVSKEMEFRKKGNVGDWNKATITTQVALVGATADIVVACDENRLIQYKLDIPAWFVILVKIRGWWL